MPASTGRRLSGFASVLSIYALTFVTAIFYSKEMLAKSPALPDLLSTPYLILAAVLPLALLVIFALRAREMLLDRLKKRFGWKLRTRLTAMFLAMALIASLPQLLFLASVTRFAVMSPSGSRIGAALGDGVSVAVDSYNRIVAALERSAKREAPGIAQRHAPVRSDIALRELVLGNPDVESVEFFARSPDDGRLASVGLAPNKGESHFPGSLASPGMLPKETNGGISRLRYHLAATGADGSPLDMLITVRLPDGFDARVERLSSAAREHSTLDDFGTGFLPWITFFFVLFVFPLLLAAALFAFSAAETLVGPLRAIENAARLAGSGDLSVRLLVKPRDEIGDVVAAVNSMIAGLESGREQEALKEKLAAWRDIAQRLAHELNNPLTPIKLTAERVLRRHKTDPSTTLPILEDSMLAIIKEVDSMNSLLSEFKTFARLPEPQYDWANLRTAIEEAAGIHIASAHGVRFDLSRIDPALVMRFDRDQIKRALSNMFLNSIDAMAGRGSISVSTDLVKRSDSRYCRISIRDTGQGIPEEIRTKVFTPYFTTKPDGTGLGLAIVERIVVEHGGFVRFQSDAGVGTTFFIDLPIDA